MAVKQLPVPPPPRGTGAGQGRPIPGGRGGKSAAMEVESYTALPLMPRSSPFPEEWGTPPPGVDDRRAWIIRNIRAGKVWAHRGEHVPWLSPKLRRPLSGREALRRLDVRVRNENWLRLLQVLAHGPYP